MLLRHTTNAVLVERSAMPIQNRCSSSTHSSEYCSSTVTAPMQCQRAYRLERVVNGHYPDIALHFGGLWVLRCRRKEDRRRRPVGWPRQRRRRLGARQMLPRRPAEQRQTSCAPRRWRDATWRHLRRCARPMGPHPSRWTAEKKGVAAGKCSRSASPSGAAAPSTGSSSASQARSSPQAGGPAAAATAGTSPAVGHRDGGDADSGRSAGDLRPRTSRRPTPCLSQ